MLPTSAGTEPATSWSPVGRRIQLGHRGRPIFSSCDIDVQWTETIWIILKEDQPRIISVKFGQNPISCLRSRCRSKNCLFEKLFTDARTGRTDERRTTDKLWSQKLTLSLRDRWAEKGYGLHSSSYRNKYCSNFPVKNIIVCIHQKRLASWVLISCVSARHYWWTQRLCLKEIRNI